MVGKIGTATYFRFGQCTENGDRGLRKIRV